MEAWEKVWQAVARRLSIQQLLALRNGLVNDDPRLIQGATTSPPPFQCVLDWPVEAACLLGYCGWKGDGLKTVGEVETFFADLCFAVDQDLGEPVAIHYLLNAYDKWPRQEMIQHLLPKLQKELDDRGANSAL